MDHAEWEKLKAECRESIARQRRKLDHWKEALRASDHDIDKVNDAIDDNRGELQHLRDRIAQVEDRHDDWDFAEQHALRQELRNAVDDCLQNLEALHGRLIHCRVRNERAERHIKEREATKEMWQRKLHHLQTHEPSTQPTPDGLIVMFDGRPCAGWIVRQVLIPARHDGVSFGVISGFRTPAESTALCMAMCNAPTCPGQCAGANSNHSCPITHTCIEHEGAIDVFPGVENLQGWCRNHGWPIIHTLPNDANHMSRTGQ